MRVLLDTNALIYLLDRRVPQGIQDRLTGLLQDVERSRGQIIVPVQVVTEYLVKAGSAGNSILESFLQSRFIVVAPFDHLAAIECAAMNKTALQSGDKRAPLPRSVAWQKVKVDRQIVAIAKVHADRIVADDADIHALAAAEKFPVQTVVSLPLPSWAQQLQIEGIQQVAQPSARRLPLRAVSVVSKPSGESD